jgi:hypothetical protein
VLNASPPPDVFSRKWLAIVILCMVPPFLLFALFGDPGKGRAAAICLAVLMTAIRSYWNARSQTWFRITAAILFSLHLPLVLLVHWDDKSYPGYMLLPIALLDYGFVYGSFKLAGKLTKHSDAAI